MYIWGYQTPVFIPIGSKKLNFYLNFSIFREQMYIWEYQTPVFIPNLYDWVKINFLLSEMFPFLGNKCTFGGTKLQFLFPSGQKNFIFSEIFTFIGNKCTFGGTKLQFLSQSGQKNFIYSENFPFLGNICTFGGTKLQFLSPICTIGSKTSFLVKFFHF